MNRLGTFVSLVLVAGLLVLALSTVFLLSVNIGPCGPNSVFGWICFFGAMVGVTVICIGIILSAFKILKYFRIRSRHED